MNNQENLNRPPSTPLSDSEKLDILNRRLKRMETSQHIQTAIAIIVFLGILNFSMLVGKLKKELK